ncbi:hypothetical protein B0H16DRAFT_1459347 [Mycena metata]|uniref:Uncharacterized protein n=1 Tax=Mycena metata TaxID=1033252 RepID=A0AAD7J0X0_9AGAR|nr:hypothetical protein B0H16DRAFT_1459347 [Mycena metata]
MCCSGEDGATGSILTHSLATSLRSALAACGREWSSFFCKSSKKSVRREEMSRAARSDGRRHACRPGVNEWRRRERSSVRATGARKRGASSRRDQDVDVASRVEFTRCSKHRVPRCRSGHGARRICGAVRVSGIRDHGRYRAEKAKERALRAGREVEGLLGATVRSMTANRDREREFARVSGVEYRDPQRINLESAMDGSSDTPPLYATVIVAYIDAQSKGVQLPTPRYCTGTASAVEVARLMSSRGTRIARKIEVKMRGSKGKGDGQRSRSGKVDVIGGRRIGQKGVTKNIEVKMRGRRVRSDCVGLRTEDYDFDPVSTLTLARRKAVEGLCSSRRRSDRDAHKGVGREEKEREVWEKRENKKMKTHPRMRPFRKPSIYILAIARDCQRGGIGSVDVLRETDNAPKDREEISQVAEKSGTWKRSRVNISPQARTATIHSYYSNMIVMSIF